MTILQARVSSSRLPGKVLKSVLGTPMLARQIERLQRANTIDELFIATSANLEDDPLEDLAKKIRVRVFRGSLNDVLDRFYQCARQVMPTHVIRLTGDCPLADPALIDQVVRFHLDGEYDYSSNALTPTWPDGMDVEVFRFSCLAEAHKEAVLPSEREHVTPFIYTHPDRYRIGSLTQENDQSSYRLTVDEPQDFELVSRIYEQLYPDNPTFGLDDIMALLSASPDILNVNKHFSRNEGFLLSQQKDRDFLVNND